MRRFLFSVFVLLLVVGIAAAFAGDSDKAASVKDAKAACGANKVDAACCAKGQTQASATLAAANTGDKEESADPAETKDHVCPDVSNRNSLKTFHEAMHPMHMALGEGDFDALRKGLPVLVDASKGVTDYKCDGYDKCSDTCRKNFDGKKAEFLESVDGLKKACKGKDNEKVTGAFNVMHEAYIVFANTCAAPEEKPAEDHSGHDHE